MSIHPHIEPLNKSSGVAELLLSAIAHINSLHESLQDEHQALSSNNLMAFERSVESKISRTSDLESIEKSLFSILNNAGFKMTKKGIADYISTLNKVSDRKKMSLLWQKMASALQECQQQNQVNGRILNMASVNIRQALDVLTGKRGNSKTYSSSGKQSKGDNSNSIAVA